MKKAIISYIKSNKNDIYRTPSEAVFPLLKYLNKKWVIWEPTDNGNSGITEILKKEGFKVISTHINKGFNFLEDEPNFEFDVIVTNPPYSLKTEFLKRAYEIKKPFCFLLPITSLEGVKRGELFRKYGIELMVFDRRVEFGEGRVWFGVGWFCWKILKEKLIFEKLPKRGDVK